MSFETVSAANPQNEHDVAAQQAVAAQAEAMQAETPIVSVTETVIDSSKETVADRGYQLYELAVKAAKRDAIDSSVYRDVNVPMNWVGMGMAATTIGATLARSPAEIIGTGFLATFTTIGHSLPIYFSKPTAKSSLKTAAQEYAYNLQCMRVEPDNEANIDGKVAIAIHPTEDHEIQGQESDATTKVRLAAALETIAKAADIDEKGIIGDVIIPAETVRKAGLPVGSTKSYVDTIDAITPHITWIPYGEFQQAVVIPANMAGKLAEMTRENKDVLLSRVFSELAVRFPAKREALTEDNAAVVKVLHGMLERTASEASGVRSKTKDISRVVARKTNDDGSRSAVQIEGWNGGIRSTTEDVTTYINRSDQFNPRVQQRTSKTLQEVANADLRTITGGDEAMVDVVGKLNGNKYDKMQLIRVALELLEVKQNQLVEDEPKKSEEPVWSGKIRGNIVADEKAVQPRRHEMRRRFIGRVGLVAAGIAVAFSTVLTVKEMIDDATPIDGPTVQDAVYDRSNRGELPPNYTGGQQQLWRIDAHGLEPKDASAPYWTQTAHYRASNLSNLQESSSVSMTDIEMPPYLPDSSEPHMTVTTLTSNPDFKPLVAEGTKVSALRAYAAGNILWPVDVKKTRDGLVEANIVTKNVYVDGNPKSYENSFFRVEYDLTRSDEPVLTPSMPFNVSVRGGIVNPNAYPDADQSTVDYVRDNFIYDASPKITEALAGKSPREYVDTAYSLARCKCDQCNTVAAIMESRKRPTENMAVVTGFMVTPEMKDGHGYIGNGPAHAWFNDGKINDATAVRTDKNSVLPSKETPVEETEKQWQNDAKDYHLAKAEWATEKDYTKELLFPWIGFMLLSGGLIEERKRYMQRAYRSVAQWNSWQTAAADIDPRDAVTLMKWHAYAKPGSPVPKLNGAQQERTETPYTVPTATLQTIARGGFVAANQLTPAQQRGLQNTAQALLRERKPARPAHGVTALEEYQMSGRHRRGYPAGNHRGGKKK